MMVFMTPAYTDKPWHSNCSYAESWLMAEYLGPRHSYPAFDYILITFNETDEWLYWCNVIHWWLMIEYLSPIHHLDATCSSITFDGHYDGNTLRWAILGAKPRMITLITLNEKYDDDDNINNENDDGNTHSLWAIGVQSCGQSPGWEWWWWWWWWGQSWSWWWLLLWWWWEYL